MDAKVIKTPTRAPRTGRPNCPVLPSNQLSAASHTNALYYTTNLHICHLLTSPHSHSSLHHSPFAFLSHKEVNTSHVPCYTRRSGEKDTHPPTHSFASSPFRPRKPSSTATSPALDSARDRHSGGVGASRAADHRTRASCYGCMMIRTA